ncbi:MAG: hypothetical protein ACO35F_10290, partial [Ilumatobacteraceae bacterium]
MKAFARWIAIPTVGALLIVGAAVIFPRQVDSAAPNKVTICHRTNSASNPYRRITVNKNSVNNNGGHRTQHVGDGPFDPSRHSQSVRGWGDIIPPSNVAGGQSGISAMNWTSIGEEIYLGTDAGAGKCGRMTTKEFYDIEVAAGIDPDDVLDEIFDSTATEDAEVVADYSGDRNGFKTAMTSNPTLLASLDLSVTTDAASSISGSSAVLNGTFSLASGASATASFEWGTDQTCTDTQTVDGDPASFASGSGTSLATLSSLTAGTYYFKAVGVSAVNTDNEAIYEGQCRSFQIADSSSSSSSSVPAS